MRKSVSTEAAHFSAPINIAPATSQAAAGRASQIRARITSDFAWCGTVVDQLTSMPGDIHERHGKTGRVGTARGDRTERKEQ